MRLGESLQDRIGLDSPDKTQIFIRQEVEDGAFDIAGIHPKVDHPAKTLAQPQDFQLQDAGFHQLGLTSDFLPHYAMGEIAVRRDWLEANADVVVRYLRANTRALHWLYDPANKAEANAILEQYTKTQPEYAARTYDLLVERLQMFARNGELDPAAFDGAIQVLVDSGELPAPAPPASKYLDTRYWEQAIATTGRR